MNEKTLKRTSKFLSLVLRHRPEAIGAQLDANGWIETETLLAKMNQAGRKIDMEALRYIVANNNKKRFAFNEDESRIRASQGHSIKVDLAYEPVEPPEFLFHGTAEQHVQSILKNGIEKRNRHDVHLSEELDTATNVGGRHGKPVILTVHSLKMHQAGHKFFVSENGVWLTAFVPAEYIELKGE